MRHSDVIVGAVLACFAGIMLLVVVPAQIPEGFAGMLSPRLVPQLALGGIGLLGLGVIAQGLRGAGHEVRFSGAELRALLAIPALLLAGLAVLSWFGPVAAGGLLVIGAALLMGERNPLSLLAQAGAMLGLGYLLLYVVLGTRVG